MSSTDRTLAAVATLGLAERDRPDVTPEGWPVLRRELELHKLIGLATAAAESGLLEVPPDVRADLAEDDLRAARHTVASDAALLDLAGALDRAAVPFRVLKGSAAVALDWSLGNRRRYIDVDLLVRGEDLERAIAVAEGLGATRPMPELRPGFDRHFGKSVTLSWSRCEIDLHRSLVRGPHCFLIGLDDLWDDPRAFELCGQELQGLNAPAALVHYAMHATIAITPRLASLRDVIECARHTDLDAAASVARRWQATAIVTMAVDEVRDRLGFDADHPLVRWAAGLRPTDTERRLAAAYRPSARETSALTLGSARYVPGLLPKARFLTAYAWPSRAHRAARNRAAWTQATQIVRNLRVPRS